MDKGANLSIVKIEASHCYKCGKLFHQNHEELERTTHHAIPQKLKPHRNILIPICKKCHGKMNDAFMPKDQLLKFKRRLTNLAEQATSIKKMMEEE